MNEKEPDLERVRDFFENHYVDRGMTKWQGYYLSDHTSALNKEAAIKNAVHEEETIQSTNEVRERLADSYANKRTVSIQQFTHRSEGDYSANVVGKVLGYQGDSLVLDVGDVINIMDIRHVDTQR